MNILIEGFFGRESSLVQSAHEARLAVHDEKFKGESFAVISLQHDRIFLTPANAKLLAVFLINVANKISGKTE